jgi:hypothetical protein
MAIDSTQQQFTEAIDALIEQVKEDRSILAAILCGSLSHDKVWAKSDVDLVLVTMDDRKIESGGVALYADGVNVHALTVRAEQALLELSRKDVPAGRFAQLAAELSNCPSSAQGGDLGWVGPDDCAPELANELFQLKSPQWGIGIHPRLVHTRFGFHIIEVIGRRKGRQASFDEVRGRVQTQLTLSSGARGLNQYMALLAGKARIEGVVLDSVETPLVQ